MNTLKAQIIKRCFDLCLSFFLIVLLFFPVLVIAVIIGLKFKENPIFVHERIGKHRKPFLLYKLRTIPGNLPKDVMGKDVLLSRFSRFLLHYKLNELPQLFNILKGDMSFVGPRPDIKGYADELSADDAVILEVKPGLTGPATIKYRNEQLLLEEKENPLQFNRDVIWPDKVKLNKAYIENWSFKKDLLILFKTLFKT